MLQTTSSFPISYGGRASGGYRNLKLFPFTLLSSTDFMLKVMPVGNLLSLGLLSSVWLFSSTLWSVQGCLWVTVEVLSVGNLMCCLLGPSSGDFRAPQKCQSDTLSVCLFLSQALLWNIFHSLPEPWIVFHSCIWIFSCAPLLQLWTSHSQF